jgi:hypothetical protein
MNSKLDPLLRIDGSVDRWAPKYLVVPSPLNEVALPQVVRLADFGGGRPPFDINFCRGFQANLSIHSFLDS